MRNEISRPTFIYHVAVFGLMADVFIPPLPLPGYVAPVSSIVAPVLFVLCLAAIRHGRLHLWWGVWLLALMGAVVFVSTCWSYLRLRVPPNRSDFVEAYKYLQFIPYAIAFQFMHVQNLERIVRKYVLIAAPIIALVAIAQLLRPTGLGLTLTRFYTSSSAQLANLEYSGNRIMLTGGDPNVGAAIGVFFIFYFALSYFDRKSILSIIGCAGFVLLTVFTQSRTALIGIGVATTAYGLVFSNAKLYVRLAVITSILVIGTYILTHLDLEYVTLGFKQAWNGTNDSLNTRIDNLTQAGIWFGQSVWLGWGPAKSIHATVIDSEYALIIERYGLLGASVFMAYIFMYIIHSRRAINARVSPNLLARCSLLYIVFGVVLMVTNNLFSGYQLMALVVLLSGSARLVTLNVRERQLGNSGQNQWSSDADLSPHIITQLPVS